VEYLNLYEIIYIFIKVSTSFSVFFSDVIDPFGEAFNALALVFHDFFQKLSVFFSAHVPWLFRWMSTLQMLVSDLLRAMEMSGAFVHALGSVCEAQACSTGPVAMASKVKNRELLAAFRTQHKKTRAAKMALLLRDLNGLLLDGSSGWESQSQKPVMDLNQDLEIIGECLFNQCSRHQNFLDFGYAQSRGVFHKQPCGAIADSAS
jgi:hypothetical protein